MQYTIRTRESARAHTHGQIGYSRLPWLQRAQWATNTIHRTLPSLFISTEYWLPSDQPLIWPGAPWSDVHGSSIGPLAKDLSSGSRGPCTARAVNAWTRGIHSCMSVHFTVLTSPYIYYAKMQHWTGHGQPWGGKETRGRLHDDAVSLCGAPSGESLCFKCFINRIVWVCGEPRPNTSQPICQVILNDWLMIGVTTGIRYIAVTSKAKSN